MDNFDPVFVHAQWAAQVDRGGGLMGGLSSRLLRQYGFDISDPAMGYGPVVPVVYDRTYDFRAPDQNPLAKATSWVEKQSRDGSIRYAGFLMQNRGDIIVKKGNGLAQTITPELEHPITGARTDLLSLEYMPRYPSAVQVEDAVRHATGMHAHTTRRNFGEERYWRNENQSFRHQERR